MRITFTIACAAIGIALIGFAFLNPALSEASRSTVWKAGIVFLLLGAIFPAVRTLRGRTKHTVAGAGVVAPEREHFAPAPSVTETAPSVAPPRTDVTLRAVGNCASEPWVRWYHVEAATATDVAARGARITVAVRGEHVGAERWRWQKGERADLTKAGARIPLVVGAIQESAQPMAVGWAVPYKNWYLTPSGSAALGRFLAPFIAGFRHVFDVTISWSEGGVERTSDASFELRFWREPSSEPRFIRLGERPSYRDQLGGFVELRDRGAALRKDGLMLSVSALNVWLGRVETWTREARDLIAEVSVADSDVFARLGTKDAPMFEGIRLHDEKHRLALRGLHVRLDHLSRFIRP